MSRHKPGSERRKQRARKKRREYRARRAQREEVDLRHDRDRSGRLTFMAHARGYVMARRPGCTPFVVAEKEWQALPLWEAKPELREAGGNVETED